MALASAVSASNLRIGDGVMDATGSIINKTDFLPTIEFKAGEEIMENEELQRLTEEADDIDNGNLVKERGSCLPTISCSLLGGHCVKYRRKCDGTVDPWGCRGGKKCKCCIPDQTTPAPLTPCPTFATTTPGVTVNPALTWLSVGSDRFVQFSQPMDWFAARSLCQDNGLQLYHPTNITAVAIYLEDNFSDDYYWLGAKGNGTHQVWADGEVLTWTDPWYNPARHFNNGTNDCLGVITFSASLAASGTVLLTTPGSCTGRTDMKVLCG